MYFLSFLSVTFLGLLIGAAVKAAPRGLRGRALLSCYTVVVGLFGIYYFLPGSLIVLLTGGEYVWLPSYGGHGPVALTGLVASVALLLFLGGYALRSRAARTTPTMCVPARPNPLAVQLAWLLVAAGVALKLYVIVGSGGLEMAVIRHSGGLRENLGLDELNPFLTQMRFLSSIADAGITWLLIQRMHLRKPAWLLLGVFVLVIVLSFVGSGKRLYMLWPLLALGLGVHFYVRPLRISLMPLGAVIVMGLGFFSLMFRIYAPAGIADVEIDLAEVHWAEGSLLRFYFMSLEFASFELLTLAIENSEAIVRQFGSAWNAFLTTNVEPFAYFVPRDLWPGKPDEIVDLSHANRAVMFGGGLTEGFGVASMLPAASWTFAGPMGLACAMALLGWLSAAADRRPGTLGVPTPRQLVTYAFVIVTLFHLFRQATLAWTAMIVLLQQFGLIAGFLLLFLIDGQRRVVRVRRRHMNRQASDRIGLRGVAHATD